MAVYDLEEQEQLDDLKAWWHAMGQHDHDDCRRRVRRVGGRPGLALVDRQAGGRGVGALFGGLSQAARANDLPKAKDATAQLEDRFARTGYAPRGALVLAKLLFDSGDTAGAARAAAMGDRPRRRNRAEGDRALSAGRDCCSTTSNTTKR